MRTLKIGVIGAGRIGIVHTETIVRHIPDARIVAIADVSVDAAKRLADRFGVPSVSGDYRTVIQNPDVDAVLICSPTDTHAQYSIEAAKAGKHVFCEKPIALDLATIQRVTKTIEACGVKFMVGFNRRFDPNFKKVRQMVADGKIGEPHIVKITSRDPAPPPPEYVKGSGGMFLDMTIHDFDMARFLIGDEVTEVFAVGGVKVDKAIGKAGDIDTAVITLQYAGGAMGVIDNSRQAVYGYDQRVEVFGSAGMVKVDNNAPDTHNYYSRNGVHASLPLNFFMDRYIEAYASEITEFCKAVADDGPVSVGAKDGLLSVAIGLAAKKSLKEHRPVKVSEVLRTRKP
jgi:myo-inositol 2-dehydrogenase / D-chiro-inositol 1-dehydrogenase